MSRTGIVIDTHGGPEVLRWRPLPDLTPTPGEVRVRVTYVGLNHLDLWVRRGVPGHDFHLPRIPGSDVAGEVLEIGPGCPASVRVGQAVALHPSWGCMACRACLDGRHNRCAAFRIRGETTD